MSDGFTYDEPVAGATPPLLPKDHVLPGVVRLTEMGSGETIETLAMTVDGKLYITSPAVFSALLSGMISTLFDQIPEEDMAGGIEALIGLVKETAKRAHPDDDPGWWMS